MTLDKLIQSRNKHKCKPFPISDGEICRRYESVTTPMVNDVLREMELLYQTLPSNIAPIKDNMKAAGIAFTIKGSKNLNIQDEMIQRAQMLEEIPEFSIIAWDTNGDDESMGRDYAYGGKKARLPRSCCRRRSARHKPRTGAEFSCILQIPLFKRNARKISDYRISASHYDWSGTYLSRRYCLRRY